MSYQIESTASFNRAVRRLARKYRLIKRDLRDLVEILADNPFVGNAIPGFAHEVWKIRLASSDMQSGKRAAIGSSTPSIKPRRCAICCSFMPSNIEAM